MFERYSLEQHDNGYTVILYVQQGLEEFASEPGRSPDKQDRLESNVHRYVQEKFPDLLITTAKVMMGTMLLSTISLAIAAPAASAASIQITFTDIKNSYAQKQIHELHQAQVIMGYPDGTFRPTGQMTREEFAIVLARSLRLDVDLEQKSDFIDVSPWAQPYVGALQKAGMANGRALNFFDAAAPVTREEMALFYIRALGLSEQARVYNLGPTFADSEAISDWARPYLAFAHEIGLIEGISSPTGVLFQPKSNAERQQVAILAHKFFNGHETYTERGNALLENNAPRIHTDVYISRSGQGSTLIEGTGKPGNTVTLTLSDGVTTTTLTATVEDDHTYQVYGDFTPFRDGNVEVVATHKDATGNTTGDATVTMNKDTTVTAPTFTDPAPITEANRKAYVINGKAEPGSTVTVHIGKSLNSPPPDPSQIVKADPNGQFSATFDVSQLANGDVVIWGVQSDLAGNNGPASAVTVTKEVPDTLPAPTIATPGPITLDNQMHYVLNGTGTPNSRIEVKAVDSTGLTVDWGQIAMTDATGKFTATIIPRKLASGPVTLTVQLRNLDGDTSAPTTLTIEKNVVNNLQPPAGTSTETVTAANQAAYPFTGTSAANAMVYFVVTDEQNNRFEQQPVRSAADGTFTRAFYLSTLADGTLTVTMHQETDNGLISPSTTYTLTKRTTE